MTPLVRFDNGLLKDTVSSNAGGLNVGYRYDDANRLEHVDDGTTGSVLTTDYGYNANGSLATVTYPNAIVHSYAYDTLNRLRTLNVSLGTTVLHGYEYKLTPSGHRRQAVEGAKTTTYTYDDLHRLTAEAVSGDSHGNNGSIGYTLDAVGNRSSRLSSLTAISNQSSTFNSRDWLSSDTYTPNGSTQIGRTALNEAPGADTYDFEEHLIVRQKADGSSINLSYDADGNRFQKTILDSSAGIVRSTTYLVDTKNLTSYAQVVEESTTNASGTIRKAFTYGTALISHAISLNSQLPTLNYFAYDGHGNVRELTDSSGAVTDRYDYDAFGNLVFRSGSTPNNYLYCGEQYDPDLGLYYLRARYLNSDSGMFWSMDGYEGKAEQPATLHKYVFANSEPTDRRDPSGRFTIVEEDAVVTDVGITSIQVIPSAQTALATTAGSTVDVPLAVRAALFLIPITLLQQDQTNHGVAIIGETTRRVEHARDHVWPNAEIFEWPKSYDDDVQETAQRNEVSTFDVLVASNYAWIQSVMQRSMLIIDIELDADRDRSKAGPYYPLEDAWTSKYRYRRKVSYPGRDHLQM